ncbi:unnamed protein product, partial [Musa textilis]
SWTASACYLGFNGGEDPFFHPVLGLISPKHLHGTATVAAGKGGVREQEPEVKLSQAIMGSPLSSFYACQTPLPGSFAAAALRHAWLLSCVEEPSTDRPSLDGQPAHCFTGPCHARCFPSLHRSSTDGERWD